MIDYVRNMGTMAGGRELQIFRGIRTLMSLAGAARKQGRRVTEADLSMIPNAALVCEGGQILWCGPESSLPENFRTQASTTVDFGGRFVYPGFVECHTHTVFGGSRAEEFEWRNQGVSYQTIAERGGGILSTVRATRAISDSELLNLAQARVDRFVQQGVTTLEIKSGYALDGPGEARILKLIESLRGPRTIRTYLGPHAIAPEFAGRPADYLDEILNVHLPELKKKKLAERVDIFVEKGYFSRELAEKYFARAKDLGFGLTVHADQLSRSGGTDLAVQFGAQSADHLVEINNQDIQALARSEVTAVLLPGADLYMNCPYPPARSLLDQGAKVALATDFNPGTCPTQDLSLMGVLARVQMKMSLAEVWVAYTLNAAQAIGLVSETGSLETGKSADFIVSSEPPEQFFYHVGYLPVDEVWLRGEKIGPV